MIILPRILKKYPSFIFNGGFAAIVNSTIFAARLKIV
jgi:hypothetical protein